MAAHPPPKEAVLEQPWSPWGHLLHIKLLDTVCTPNLTWTSPKVPRCLTAPCCSSHRRVDIPVLQIPPYGSFIPVFLVTAVQQTTPGGCGLLDLAMAHEELGLASVFFSPIASGRNKATRGCQIDSCLCLDFCSSGENLGCGDEYFKMWGLGISMATCFSSTLQSKYRYGCVSGLLAVYRHFQALLAELLDFA